MSNSKAKTKSANIVKTTRPAEANLLTVDSELKVALPEDIERRLLQALQVYQVELELQNAELSQARDEVESMLENYTELYDFAPVGYCTLDRDGIIRRVNLTGATLLGDQRSRLLSLSLALFLSEVDKPIFREMLAMVFNGQQQKALCEVTINPKGLRSPTPVKIVATASANADECLVVVIDITERKRLEAQILTANDEIKLRQAQDQAAELLSLNRKLVEEIEARKKLEESLRDSQVRLRNLSANLQFIREEERKSIAREIHDELGQLLASIQIGVSLLAVEYAANGKLVSSVHDMETLIGKGIKTVQRIAAELRPAMLDVLGLADALEWQSNEFGKRTGIDSKITVLLLKLNVDPDVATALFRIYQESLTNVQRHSLATRVEAHLVERKRNYRLTVRDNGRGVTAEEISSPHSIGLIGIRERVFLLGGRVKIFGSPEQGTMLFVRIPTAQKEKWHVHTQENHHR